MRPKIELLPRGIKVPTFADIHKWLSNFVAGNFRLLFVIGRPGLGE